MWIGEVIANTVLCVAGCVQRGDLYRLAKLKSRIVCRRAGNVGAIFAADDGRAWKMFQHLLVASSMVPMVVCVNDRGQVDFARGDLFFHNRGDFGGVGGVDEYGIFARWVADDVGIVVGAANPYEWSV